MNTSPIKDYSYLNKMRGFYSEDIKYQLIINNNTYKLYLVEKLELLNEITLTGKYVRHQFIKDIHNEFSYLMIKIDSKYNIYIINENKWFLNIDKLHLNKHFLILYNETINNNIVLYHLDSKITPVFDINYYRYVNISLTDTTLIIMYHDSDNNDYNYNESIYDISKLVDIYSDDRKRTEYINKMTQMDIDYDNNIIENMDEYIYEKKILRRYKFERMMDKIMSNIDTSKYEIIRRQGYMEVIIQLKEFDFIY